MILNILLIVMLLGNAAMTVFNIMYANWPGAIFSGCVTVAVTFCLGTRLGR
jgi:hypothetical protein